LLILIIEIDGYFHQVLLTGKKLVGKNWRKSIYRQKNCLVILRISNYEEIPYDSGMHVDFVIDTDIDRIYTPTY